MRTRANCKRGEDRVAANDRDDGDHRDHDQREQDQELADPKHGALKVADGLRILHQLRRLAEVGVRARAVDEGADLTLADDRSREHRIAGCSRGGQGLPGQRGLVHLDGIALQQACICRHDVAEAQSDDVARHQFARGRRDPFAVAQHPRLDRELGLQGVDGLASLMLLGESDDAVRDKQDQDDEEVRPVPQHPGQDHRDFDHPRDRSPEVGEELEEGIGLLLFDLVRPVLGEALFRLGVVRPSGEVSSRFSTSASGRVFRSSFAAGFESACTSGTRIRPHARHDRLVTVCWVP